MKFRARRSRAQFLEPADLNILSEVQHILKQAQHGKITIVGVAGLVFFSAASGDAWVLDPAEGYALCLAREGAPEPYKIAETPERFSIVWTASYYLEQDAFVVQTNDGRSRFIIGYPVAEIRRTAEHIGVSPA